MVLVVDLGKVGLHDLDVGHLTKICIAHKYCNLVCKKQHIEDLELERIRVFHKLMANEES